MQLLDYYLARPFAFSVVLAFALGAALAWAMPPSLMVAIPFIVLPLYFVVLRTMKTAMGAALAGWAFGFGFHVMGLHWIANALLVDDNPYAWAYPLALIGLPMLLALFDAVAAATIKISGRFDRVLSVIRFASILTVAEIIRGHAFTGFPWNLLGYAWSDHLPMLQLSAFGGIYALSFLTYVAAAMPALFLIPELSARTRATAIAATVLVLGGVYGGGMLRLDNSPTDTYPQRSIVLVQPNIAQSDKWDSDRYDDHLRLHLGLSRPLPGAAASDDLETLILWPEAAVPAEYVTYSAFQAAIAQTLSHYGGTVVLATGAIQRTQNGFANSVVMYDRQGARLGAYDKHHLVPFGEYIPFQEHIPLAPIARFQGLIAGPGPQTVMAGPFALSPLVCYEGIFPSAARDRNGPRPDLLVSVTNDAWYGPTAGPSQHFAQTRVRAIEEGIPLARAAQTGISGVVDAYGRILIETPPFTQSRIHTDWPTTTDIPTLFAQHGNLPVIILVVITIALTLRPQRRGNASE